MKFPDSGPYTILIIDDDDSVRVSVAMFLEDLEYTVLSACDGEEGLAVFREQHPDLVLLDLSMPKMGGLKVLAILKEISPDTPVIVVSGTGVITDVVEALRAGAWNFLLKPVTDLGVLKHAVSYALERKWFIQKNKEHHDELEEKVKLRTRELAMHKENLEELVAARTEALRESLQDLKDMQSRLVVSEKMASLGRLVAGVAHEINTPVGIGVTAITYLQEKIAQFAKKYEAGDASHDDFKKFMETLKEGAQMISGNLYRASELIGSFKQIAVDQSSEAPRKFNLCHYLNDVFVSLKPRIKKTPYQLVIHCPKKLNVTSYPGALSQIVTNMVINALTHAFGERDTGTITIDITERDGEIQLVCADDGNGMPEENVKQVFEPFFTTKRNRGGTGLGMHLVYNIVTQTLKGDIACHSKLGEGTSFVVTFASVQG